MAVLANPMPFGEVLEAVEGLTLGEQTELAEILRRRLAERGRARAAEDVRESRREFAEGGCRPSNVNDLMNEILS